MNLATRRTLSYYESNADAYVRASVTATMLPHGARFAARLAPGARVLDLGSGSGRDLAMLRELGLDPVGLDLSFGLATRARELSGFPVAVADMRALPFRSESFGGIWASASLLHLGREEVGGALEGCRRVLKAGGLLFASLKIGSGEQVERDRTFTLYEAPEWQRVLRDAGFRPISSFAESAHRIRGNHGLSRTDTPGDVRWLATLAELG